MAGALATVIFLDLDGVVRVGGCYQPQAIVNLNALCTMANAKMVISGSDRGKRSIRAELKRAGVNGRFHSAWHTPLSFNWKAMYNPALYDPRIATRGGQIAMWHNANPGHTRYIILEDSNDILPEQHPHWVQPDESVGLTPTDIAKAMVLLARQPAP